MVFCAENLRSLGKYTLTLNAVLNENGATVYGGRELPSYVHDFTIKGKVIFLLPVVKWSE